MSSSLIKTHDSESRGQGEVQQRDHRVRYLPGAEEAISHWSGKI